MRDGEGMQKEGGRKEGRIDNRRSKNEMQTEREGRGGNTRGDSACGVERGWDRCIHAGCKQR